MRKKILLLPPVVVLGVCAAVLWGAPRRARADLILNVSVDTSSLQGEPGSEVYFAFTDGSGLGDGNNTVTLSGFSLGGGALDGVDPFSTFGGAAGDMASNVSITDSSSYSQFAELLTAGTSLAFTLDATTNAEQGAIPDGLFMFLSDPNGNFVPTNDPSGANSLFAISVGSGLPSVVNYDSAQVSLAVPPTSVPEPDSSWLASSGILALVGAWALRRRRSHEYKDDLAAFLNAL